MRLCIRFNFGLFRDRSGGISGLSGRFHLPGGQNMGTPEIGVKRGCGGLFGLFWGFRSMSFLSETQVRATDILIDSRSTVSGCLPGV